MPLEEPVHIIINGCAGTAQKLDLVARLNKYVKLDPRWRVSVARSGTELIDLAKQAAHDDDCQIVVAAGGDGTVSTVAGALVGTPKKLGVLPVGTLNHFAKDLHIPLDLEDALRTIADRHVIAVDIGEVNGRIFINNSSLGLYPNIVQERQKQERLGWGKWPAFVWAAVAVLRRYPLVDVRLMIRGAELHCRTPFVFVGNNKYAMEGFHIGARERLDSGELSLYITNRTGRLALIRLALRALVGGLRNEKDFAAMTTQEVWITTPHRRLQVAADGEVANMLPPLHYRVHPRTLQVIVPANPDSSLHR